MTKATHTGTCQCCGATQKLPNGLLSKHGYTIDNGWFQGTCYGAGHLPFEQSKDLIEGLIESAQKHITETKAAIEELAQSEDSKKAWNHSYRSYNECSYGQKSGYFWEQRELIVRDFERNDKYEEFVWHYADDEKKPRGADTQAEFERKGTMTLGEAVKKQNAKYIKRVLEPQIRQAETYIKWQQERIANWKPQELTPVK